MTVWETGTYHDAAYVKITPSELARSEEDDELEDVAIYYAASGEALIVTLDEDVLKRAVDRQAARRRARAEGRSVERPGLPWLGSNFCLQADRKIIRLIEAAYGEDYHRPTHQEQHIRAHRLQSNPPDKNRPGGINGMGIRKGIGHRLEILGQHLY